MGDGCFKPYQQQLGSFSRRKQVWMCSAFNELGLFQSCSVYEKHFKTSDIVSDFFQLSAGHLMSNIGHDQ